VVRRLISLAFVVAAVATGSVLSATADATTPGAELGEVRVEDGRLHVTFSAHGLPSGTQLDLSGLRVELGGIPVPATVATEPRPRQDGVALVVLDTSGSMTGAPVATARAAVGRYLSALPTGVQVGLITFSAQPVVAVPPTADRQQLIDALERVQPHGTSALNDAVAAAARVVAGVPGARRLLVLSDGEDVGSATSLDDVTRLLVAAGVKADVVALDVTAGATAKSRDTIAHSSGGQVLAVGDTGTQAALFGDSATRRLEVIADVPVELSGRDARLTVAVPAGEQVLTAEADAMRMPGHRADLVPGGPSWMLPAVLGVIFAVFSGLGWLWTGSHRAARRARRHRLSEVRRYRVRDGAEPETGAVQEPSRPMRLLLALSERIVSGRGVRERLTLDLDLAGVRLRPAEWLLVRFGIAVVVGVVLAAVTGAPVVCGPLGVLLGWFGGRFFLKFRIGRRRALFGEQLPDTLQLVAGALRSGFSLAQALDSVVREGTQPIAGEIARSLARTRLGVSVEDALDKAADRMQCQDLSWVVMAIRIQREVGGNLAELLLTTVGTMRERATVRRQVKALTAEGRMSAYVLISLPIGLGTWLFVSRRDYIEPLYTRPVGWMMLGATVVCLSIGWFWMNKMIKVEV
jgi:tight adherence protein B